MKHPMMAMAVLYFGIVTCICAAFTGHIDTSGVEVSPTPTYTLEVPNTPSITPTDVPVATPEPTAIIDIPEEIVEKGSSVYYRECDEEERWWLEVFYDGGAYEQLLIVGVEYEGGIISFYLGYSNDNWELICYAFG